MSIRTYHSRANLALAKSLLVAFLLPAPLFSQGVKTRPPQVIETELLNSLDVGRLHAGAPVLARVKYDWANAGCRLRAGTTIVGHVVDVVRHSKQNKTSSMTVVFDRASCGDKTDTSIVPVLYAVIGSITMADPDMAERDGLFGLNATRAQYGASVDLPGSNLASDMSASLGVSGSIRTGVVIGLDKIKLSVGTGTEGGSVITSPNRNAFLEQTTRLMLIRKSPPSEVHEVASAKPLPVAMAPADNGANLASPEPHEAAAPPPPTIDETDICSLTCTSVGDTGPGTHTNAFASISVGQLSYQARSNREFTALNDESALIYLDPDNLLFTFDLHKMRHRSGDAIRTESMRSIRAVLIDASTHTVKSIVDWEVQGEGQYLWRAGQGRVLVHVGHQLRLLGPDFTPVRILPVPGILKWVASSPDGGHFAVGILHERHSPALHQLILNSTHVEPEEDIDVSVYDGNFSQILTATQPTTMLAPVLEDSGEIQAHSAEPNRWRISEFRWDGSEHRIAEISSTCQPSLSTPLSGRIFVTGCTPPFTSWYRLLRLDGHTVLRDHGSSDEMAQAARSTIGTEIAIRVVRTFQTRLVKAFRTDDLREQEISIYDPADGHLLFTTTAEDMPPTEQTFAPSPNGHEIAVLHKNSIEFYSLENAALAVSDAIPSPKEVKAEQKKPVYGRLQ